jgi:hypothetical protein
MWNGLWWFTWFLVWICFYFFRNDPVVCPFLQMFWLHTCRPNHAAWKYLPDTCCQDGQAGAVKFWSCNIFLCTRTGITRTEASKQCATGVVGSAVWFGIW